MDGRTASVAFQLEVVDKMIAAVVFVAVEPCKTFAVETEVGEIYVAFAVAESLKSLVEVSAFDLPYVVGVLRDLLGQQPAYPWACCHSIAETVAKLLPSFLVAAVAASRMMHMTAGGQLVGTVVDVVVVVVVANHPSSCKETVAEEVPVAAIVHDSSAGRVKYLLVNSTNNGSSSAVYSATENADL